MQISENALSEEAKTGLNKILKMEKTVDRENLLYRTNEQTYSFKKFLNNKHFQQLHL